MQWQLETQEKCTKGGTDGKERGNKRTGKSSRWESESGRNQREREKKEKRAGGKEGRNANGKKGKAGQNKGKVRIAPECIGKKKENYTRRQKTLTGPNKGKLQIISENLNKKKKVTEGLKKPERKKQVAVGFYATGPPGGCWAGCGFSTFTIASGLEPLFLEWK